MHTENYLPRCSGHDLKVCVWDIVKTQVNHNQVKVGLTTVWVLTHHPPTTQVKLCVVVVQVSSKQRKQQHNTGLNYGFLSTHLPTHHNQHPLVKLCIVVVQDSTKQWQHSFFLAQKYFPPNIFGWVGV